VRDIIVIDDHVARFVGERCNTIIYPPFTAMGIERDGEIIGGVVFNCYTRFDIAVTVAGHGFTRRFVRAVGNYVFDQLGCLRLSITTEQDQVVDFAKRLGAQTEGRKRNHFGRDRHGIVLGILKEDWKL
jgi:RimJ/RimL family protein N-acetyltransferase